MFNFYSNLFTGNRESVLFFYIFGFAREIQNIVTAYVGCKGLVYGVYTFRSTFLWAMAAFTNERAPSSSPDAEISHPNLAV